MLAVTRIFGNPSVDSREAGRYQRNVRTVYVSEYPVVQHLHSNNDVVTVRLKRQGGEFRAVCADCDTEFIYRKPKRSTVQHFKSPLLPGVKGNFDTDGDH